ncbi:MAG TPA: lytic transglycosylase domain-containing protein [Solirubrobacteraceae bacterium]|jgi:soluble lytic murein transglycosylase-like protein|nr:lytic transglycosylase domain-containing protein [Solirubrobacteraceae bacterium]
MSTQSVIGVPAGELAIAQRVQQLQTLIEATRTVAAGGVLSSSTASPSTSAAPSQPEDFASALQSATSADTVAADAPAVADTPAGVPGAEGTGLLDAAYQPASATGGEGGDYEALVTQAAARNGLDPAVLHGLIQQESGFDAAATSGAGAMGLTQLMPGTASSLGVANPMNPAESIEGGARYLGELMRQFGGNTSDALAAYNAGPGAVQEYGGIPPYSETQSYVSSVLRNAESYRQSHPATSTGELL